MKAFEIVSPDGIDALKLADRPTPEPGPGEVLVRIRANSINFRDLSTILDPEPRGIPYPRIPNSDGAGEVLAIGPGVTEWKAGDRVASTFFRDWDSGGISAAVMASALGGATDGVLAEEVILPERGLVAIPDYISYEEAATLPCAALTAWRSLVEEGKLRAGETVLLLGTGGVSIFALQIAKMHGATVIQTSSSDEKLARVKSMGADHCINYRDTPEWQDAVMEITGGIGADHVVEVGGGGTLARSAGAVRVGGHIALIGILTMDRIDPTLLMRKSVHMTGIYVGSRQMFRSMLRAFEAHQIRPVIDQNFPLTEAREAFHHMKAAGHFGKITISL